ncbi:MAG: hypothetical protein LBH75_04835 [Treponema sp.]|jgi:hypothetical protein|nr:hypothetical protein [Treponema sp.]
MNKISSFCVFLFMPAFLLHASPIVSSAWGFFLDLPEEYELRDGDGQNVFSFQSNAGVSLDLKVDISGVSLETLAETVQKQLKNEGETEIFDYRDGKAFIIELDFVNGGDRITGYGLGFELEKKGDIAPLLLALAYNRAETGDMTFLHASALDSIAPVYGARLYPGAMTVYSFPRGELKLLSLAGGEGKAFFHENAAAAAQYVVDREDMVLSRYASSPLWKEAWLRFYRMIYRDSFDRVKNAAFILERMWNVPSLDNRSLADKALKWVQAFSYERDLEGSDFINVVTAAIEGRGDCDSRALLWAIILRQANIPSAIMISRDYGHAMGLADVVDTESGDNARFSFDGKDWLVAETTAEVDIGLIGESVKDPRRWIGVELE